MKKRRRKKAFKKFLSGGKLSKLEINAIIYIFRNYPYTSYLNIFKYFVLMAKKNISGKYETGGMVHSGKPGIFPDHEIVHVNDIKMDINKEFTDNINKQLEISLKVPISVIDGKYKL